MSEKTTILSELRDVIGCMRLARADFRLLAIAAAFSATLVLISLYIVSLLFPLAEGLITQDFAPVRHIHGLRYLTQHLPESLTTNSALFCILVAWLYVCILIKAALSFASVLMVRMEGESAASAVRMLMLERYLSFGKGYFDQRSPEKIRSKISLCTTWVKRQLIAFHMMISDLLKLAAYMGVMLFISWKLTVALLLVAPAVIYITQRIVLKLQHLARAETHSMENLNLKTVEMLARIPLVQAFGKKARELAHLAALARAQFALAVHAHKLESAIRPFQEIGVTTAQLLMAWSLALVGTSSTLPPSEIFVFFYLASAAFPLVNSVHKFRVSIAAHGNGKAYLQSVLNDEEKFFVQEGSETFTGLKDNITFHNLYFSYGRGHPVFHELSFTLKAGQATALTGATGAGKTTIAHLLLRLYECAPGAITIDGKDVGNYTIESLRRQMAFVEQHPAIIDDTLRANLCYALDAPPQDALLERVLEMCRLKDFIASLPQGLETPVGDQGVQLSGGEKQRIALCRALLKEAPILILDEATSALDAQTEEAIMRAVIDYMRGRTLILISHRLSAVRHADCILVLEKERIAESGTFEALSANSGAFSRCFGLGTHLGKVSR